jgi:hypothetical protein
LDLSLDGKRLLFSTDRVNVDLAELPLASAGGRERLVRNAAGVRWLTSDASRGELAPVYSPDGSLAAYFSNRRGAELETIWTMEANGSKAVPLVEDARVSVYPRWTADGESLVYMSRQGFSQFQLRRAARSTTRVETLISRDAFSAPWGDVSVDGRVAFGAPDGKVRILDSKSGHPGALDTRRASHLRWSRDGRLLAYIVVPQRAGDTDAGAWVYDFQHAPREPSRAGLWQEWTRAGDLLVARPARSDSVDFEGSPRRFPSRSSDLLADILFVLRADPLDVDVRRAPGWTPHHCTNAGVS